MLVTRSFPTRILRILDQPLIILTNLPGFYFPGQPTDAPGFFDVTECKVYSLLLHKLYITLFCSYLTRHSSLLFELYYFKLSGSWAFFWGCIVEFRMKMSRELLLS